jgi:hypothetical protein
MDARRSRRQCSTAWSDLTNAFGSVDETIVTFLQLASLNEDAISVICRSNVINTTTICSHQGFTPGIIIHQELNKDAL